MFTKHSIRRALFGTCTVTPSRDFVVTPHEVTLSVQRRCSCWPLVTSSRRVATFLFEELMPWKRVSAHGLLDLEYLFKCSRRADVEFMQIKVCVKDFYGDKSVFRLGLDDCLTQLLHSGRHEWFFLDISEGKVVLWLANQDEQRWDDQQASEGETQEKCSLQDEEQSIEGDTQEKCSLQDEETMNTQNTEYEELDSGWETVDDDEDDTETQTEEISVQNMTQEETETTSRCRLLEGVRVVWRYTLGALLVAGFVALIWRW